MALKFQFWSLNDYVSHVSRTCEWLVQLDYLMSQLSEQQQREALELARTTPLDLELACRRITRVG